MALDWRHVDAGLAARRSGAGGESALQERIGTDSSGPYVRGAPVVWRQMEGIVEKLYENDRFEFALLSKDGDGVTGAAGATGARIVRTVRTGAEEGAETILFDYSWPEQLTVEVTGEKAALREDGVLCWQLHVTAHHVKGVIQGEFTETEWFELENPFGSADEMICRTVDIVRKTRFAIAERHLKHLPHQTYPPVDGRQGPYGHP